MEELLNELDRTRIDRIRQQKQISSHKLRKNDGEILLSLSSSMNDDTSKIVLQSLESLQSAFSNLLQQLLILEHDNDTSTAGITTTTSDVAKSSYDDDIHNNYMNNNSNTENHISVEYIYNVCQSITSDLETIQLVYEIYDVVIQTTDPMILQTTLFDLLGTSDQSMNVLSIIIANVSSIQQSITKHDIDRFHESIRKQQHYPNDGTDHDDDNHNHNNEEYRRQILLQEAIDAAQMAEITQAQVDAMMGRGTNHNTNNISNSATHTIARTSDKQILKMAEKAKKRAQQTYQRAKDAGMILDDVDLLQLSDIHQPLGTGGYRNRTNDEIWDELQTSLLPSGTREYYDHRGLPKDAIREYIGKDIERVIIPATARDLSSLPKRLHIHDIMDSQFAIAFDGTQSLNPMQSSTFPIAFHSRDNMMICAPTGAGKTNVAMLTVVAHFRDVGLIHSGSSRTSDVIETGKKVVYIAPMKALAQEVVEKFSSKLKALQLIVRELTGDMQLSRMEAESANVIVTTPEKWDVVTRKSGMDENALGNQCGLLIIDEVHLLADERGAVIESVVSRLHRLVESRQRQVRIVALSATLPNYDDVANFLQVPERGIFYFGPEYRPVPLQQTFIGVTVNNKNRSLKEKRMNEICFDAVLDSLQRGYQVMVFVHSRKGTGDTATALSEIASSEGVLDSNFVTAGKDGPNGEAYIRYADRVNKSRNREVSAHFQHGMGIHHAGMLRGDRKLTEQMFNDGAIKVLCCTATLAWGINLPAHTVIIKGTEVYNPEKGGIVDLSILDVQQIFGRAGRPQFDSSGEATLITTNDAFPRYMNKLVRPIPIESNFIKQLADHLNAEVVGGTVTNIDEASRWLTYTYLYVRMMRNPLAYGINADQKENDPNLRRRCLDLVSDAAKQLDANTMLRYDQASGNLGIANNGRVAAHFYIQSESVATFLEMFKQIPVPSDGDLCRIICSATEFRNMKLRQEEMDELQQVATKACPFRIKGAGTDDKGNNLITDPTDKAFVLLQAYISRSLIKSFTLISDMNYIASNAGRVARALFEMCLQEKKAAEAAKLLRIANSVDKQNWWFKTPLRHFESELKETVYSGIESYFSGSRRSSDAFEDVLSLLELQPDEVGQICKSNKSFGAKVQRFAAFLPKLLVSCVVKPITSTVLRFHVQLVSKFQWDGRWHGGAQNFWLWVEDRDSNKMHHHEHVILSKRTYTEPVTIDFSIPIFSDVPKQYYIRVIADGWVGVEHVFPVPLQDFEIPQESTPHTDLLDLTPLPTAALNNVLYEQLYSKFETFNPIQTQLFHVLYYTDTPVLLGAPTGSGKTLVAELAILRLKRLQPNGICVYIAPLKALAGERVKDWRQRFGEPPLCWKVLELSGDTHHDQSVLERADILVCTPEKWDLVSRGWRGLRSASDQTDMKLKEYISRVRLLIMDEVHLLGEERGAVLEAIVSRTRFISRHVASSSMEEQSNTRIIGLSTALANPIDLADWIGIDTKGNGATSMRGLYNFRPSVRPVPTTVHVQGFSGNHYCPRMATMNKPCFAAIKEHSPNKPTLIFVASRRQTRLTAFDIISYAASDDVPKMFLGCDEIYIEAVAEKVHDEALRHTITFGIGLHHAGLSSHDRDIVERMYMRGEIKVLIATSTLAWGVNLPAHLVIVKGTEYFDGKSSRYVDYPLTDVLQMIGRAGRPGFDTHAVAVVMAKSDKKDYYNRFLYNAFPVESCLDERINENLNAEIAIGSINNKIDCVEYLTWTYFARRVKKNPMYYGAESSSDEHVEALLFDVVEQAVENLRSQGCIEMQDLNDNSEIQPTPLGIASSQYYLKHQTPKQLQLGIRECRKITLSTLRSENNSMDISSVDLNVRPFSRSVHVDEKSIAWILLALCSTHEFDELPVRHNEEFLNEELSESVMWGPDVADLLSNNHEPKRRRNIEIFLDPHTKAFLLIQAFLEHTKLPISDYVNDTKSVLENVPRFLAAMYFIASSDGNVEGSFEVMTQLIRTRQVLSSRCKVTDDPLLRLPGFNESIIRRLVSSHSHNFADAATSLVEFRLLQRKDADLQIHKLFNGGPRQRKDDTLNTLFSLPLAKLKETKVSVDPDKRAGKILISIDLERQKFKEPKFDEFDNDAFTLTLLLGTATQRFLLASNSVRIARFGTWTVSKEMIFDWTSANAEGGKIILRLLIDEVRGLDFESIISL